MLTMDPSRRAYVRLRVRRRRRVTGVTVSNSSFGAVMLTSGLMVYVNAGAYTTRRGGGSAITCIGVVSTTYDTPPVAQVRLRTSSAAPIAVRRLPPITKPVDRDAMARVAAPTRMATSELETSAARKLPRKTKNTAAQDAVPNATLHVLFHDDSRTMANRSLTSSCCRAMTSTAKTPHRGDAIAAKTHINVCAIIRVSTRASAPVTTTTSAKTIVSIENRLDATSTSVYAR